MSSRKAEIANTIIGFALIGLLVFGLYKIFVAVALAIKSIPWGSLDPTWGVALIAGIISVAGIITGQILTRRSAIKLENRKKQIESYDAFLDTIFHFFNEEDQTKKDQLMNKINFDFTHDVMLWGSRKVLKKYFEFKEFAKLHSEDGMGMLKKLEELIFAMRSDLGHSRKMQSGELLSIMFNEPSNELKAMLKIK